MLLQLFAFFKKKERKTNKRNKWCLLTFFAEFYFAKKAKNAKIKLTNN